MDNKTLKKILYVLVILLMCYVLFYVVSCSIVQYRTRVVVEHILEQLPPPEF